MLKKQLFFLLVCSIPSLLFAQAFAEFKGKVVDENKKPIEGVAVFINGEKGGEITDRKGSFVMEVPAERELFIVFSHISFKTKQFKLTFKKNEIKSFKVELASAEYKLDEVEITEEKNRDNTMERVDSKNLKYRCLFKQ